LAFTPRPDITWNPPGLAGSVRGAGRVPLVDEDDADGDCLGVVCSPASFGPDEQPAAVTAKT